MFANCLEFMWTWIQRKFIFFKMLLYTAPKLLIEKVIPNKNHLSFFSIFYQFIKYNYHFLLIRYHFLLGVKGFMSEVASSGQLIAVNFFMRRAFCNLPSSCKSHWALEGHHQNQQQVKHMISGNFNLQF